MSIAPPDDPSRHDDRRSEPRLSADQVPWIREVKPVTGDTARLVDISRRGLQLETTARLVPGRHSAVVLVDADARSARAEGLVVRTQLIAIGPRGDRIYRSALRFAEPLDLRIPLTLPPAAPGVQLPQPPAVLEGPLEGIVSMGSAPQLVSVVRISETGCSIRSLAAGVVGQEASIDVFFAPDRPIALTGSIVGVDSDQGCVVRFTTLAADVRRLLRAAVREEPRRRAQELLAGATSAR